MGAFSSIRMKLQQLSRAAQFGLGTGCALTERMPPSPARGGDSIESRVAPFGKEVEVAQAENRLFELDFRDVR
jgi:hypothetical protein